VCVECCAAHLASATLDLHLGHVIALLVELSTRTDRRCEPRRRRRAVVGSNGDTCPQDGGGAAARLGVVGRELQLGEHPCELPPYVERDEVVVVDAPQHALHFEEEHEIEGDLNDTPREP
jgi:hypothetical protein